MKLIFVLFPRIQVEYMNKLMTKFLLLEKVLTSSKEELKIYKKISKHFEAVYVNMPYYYENVFQQINKYI